MTKPSSAEAAPQWRRVAGLTFLLALPSIYLFEKYAGHLSVPIYLFVVAAAAWGWESAPGRALVERVGERRARAGAVVTFLLLVVVFAVVYPLANSGRFGPGSDGDEALNLATRALLKGQFPYYEKTYLDNWITPMPGELVLAAPFVLLGDGVYQWFFWMAAGALALWIAWRRRSARTWLFTALVLIACPAVVHQLVIGSDYMANALMVLLPAIGLVTGAARGAGPAEMGALALVLGLGLSSRGNYAFVAPLVFSRLWQTLRPRAAAIVSCGIAATAAAVTLPFYLHDPAAFSPLHTRRKLAELNAVLPHTDLILPAGALVLSLGLASRRWNGDTAAFLRNAAIVEGFLIAVPALLYASTGTPAPAWYTIFGLLFLPFGLAVYAAATAPRSSATG